MITQLAPSTTLFQLLATIVNTGARSAVKYESPTYTVKLTRRNKPDKRAKRVEFVLTHGAPNYSEHEFIRRCKRAGEPFPVLKVQLKHYPKRRK